MNNFDTKTTKKIFLRVQTGSGTDLSPKSAFGSGSASLRKSQLAPHAGDRSPGRILDFFVRKISSFVLEMTVLGLVTIWDVQ